jgi:hypothetical protein
LLALAALAKAEFGSIASASHRAASWWVETGAVDTAPYLDSGYRLKTVAFLAEFGVSVRL